jgi:hypothetical protein
MRILTCIILLYLLSVCLAAQEKARWQRLYTYDEAAVELDAANVTFASNFTGRVRIRFAYTKSQSPGGKAGVKYKSIIETMECKCEENQYRVMKIERFDGKGNCVAIEEAEPQAEWKSIAENRMRDRLFRPACRLIYEKKRNP